MKVSMRHCLKPDAWCYLYGGLEAKHCPGTVKSSTVDYYWTRDADIMDMCKKKIIADSRT